jgi:hypothetical protein
MLRSPGGAATVAVPVGWCGVDCSGPNPLRLGRAEGLTEARDNRSILRIAIVAVAVAVGLAFIALAIVYWALPADSLPSWLPGHKSHANPRHGHHHKRHGLAAFLAGVTALAVTWDVIRNRDS